MLVLLSGAMIATALGSWLEELGLEVRAASALAGDVSQRRYFRVELGDGGPSRIAAHYPESLRATMTRFVAAQALLASAGVRVPEIYQWSAQRGWMLVEDLGAATLFESGELPLERRNGYFAAAVEAPRGSRAWTPTMSPAWAVRRSTRACCGASSSRPSSFCSIPGLAALPARAAPFPGGARGAVRTARRSAPRALPSRLHGAQPRSL
jgi:hypothetical protein